MSKDLPKRQLSDNTLSEKDISSTNQPNISWKLAKNKEFGGPKGLEPTRYGDWEVNGRVSDF